MASKKRVPSLKFSPPVVIKKRLKMMMFGPAGVGKTTAAIQFPKPAIIDTERGAENDQYIKLINDAGGQVLQTYSFDEIVSQVRALATADHDFQTLVIDPVTTVYNTLADQWKRRVGDAFYKHRAEASRDWDRLCALCHSLDMNVVFTCHAKNEWDNGAMTGRKTFDGPKGADYFLDLLIELKRVNGKVMAQPAKSRIEGMPIDESFEFSYDSLAERYGRDQLERKAAAIAFASEDQVNEIEELLTKRKDGEELYGKILTKNTVETFADLQYETANKVITWLRTN